jgi:alkylhydroperoxidase/carboxymuconolactone decarboxylase family protein YurZ
MGLCLFPGCRKYDTVAAYDTLAKQARAAGATEEEIKQAIRIAYYVAGMQTLAAGSAAFEE